MQGHQRGFVAVLIMHVVNDVQRSHILFCQPVHEVIHTLHDGVEVQHIIADFVAFRSNLHFQFFIHAAVDCVEQGFRQVCTCTKELHLFADNHRADATGDGVVIIVEIRTHQVIVLILQR